MASNAIVSLTIGLKTAQTQKLSNASKPRPTVFNEGGERPGKETAPIHRTETSANARQYRRQKRLRWETLNKDDYAYSDNSCSWILPPVGSNS